MENRDITEKVADWATPPRPNGAALEGQYARLEPLSATAHAAAIFQENSADDGIWDYLPYGPFDNVASYRDWVAQVEGGDDPMFLAIYHKQRGIWGGVASYLRITPASGSIEVGHINLAPALQRTVAATEAMFLMMQWAFDAGYRRYEWKCDAANLRSCRAAQRFGFSYEGIFRQATVVKGRNRDTAWFAAIDKEWPALQRAFKSWLAADNFEADGRQKSSLRALTAPVLVGRDPRLD